MVDPAVDTCGGHWWHECVLPADLLTKRRHVDLVRVAAQACRIR
ncbi:putative leader peptide [Saccharopolyspora sp. NPDC049357]